jgi:uncharacterized lipoprotein YehR (DUF1307 family)
MKKLLSVLIILLVLFTATGCKKKRESLDNILTCVKEETNDGKKINNTLAITYKDKEIQKLKSTTVSEMDPTTINLTMTIGSKVFDELNKIDGINMKYQKVSNKEIGLVIEIDYTKIDTKKIKEKLGKLYDSDAKLYNLQDTSIDDLEEELEKEGYSCK